MNYDCNGQGTIQSGAENALSKSRDRGMADGEAAQGNDQRQEKKKECWVGKADKVRKFMSINSSFVRSTGKEAIITLETRLRDNDRRSADGRVKKKRVPG